MNEKEFEELFGNTPFEDIKKIQQYINKNYIPVQKIKDKIKELKQEDREWTEELSEPSSNFKNIDMNLKRIKNQINVLQELLGGKEQNE